MHVWSSCVQSMHQICWRQNQFDEKLRMWTFLLLMQLVNWAAWPLPFVSQPVVSLLLLNNYDNDPIGQYWISLCLLPLTKIIVVFVWVSRPGWTSWHSSCHNRRVHGYIGHWYSHDSCSCMEHIFLSGSLEPLGTHAGQLDASYQRHSWHSWHSWHSYDNTKNSWVH